MLASHDFTQEHHTASQKTDRQVKRLNEGDTKFSNERKENFEKNDFRFSAKGHFSTANGKSNSGNGIESDIFIIRDAGLFNNRAKAA